MNPSVIELWDDRRFDLCYTLPSDWSVTEALDLPAGDGAYVFNGYTLSPPVLPQVQIDRREARAEAATGLMLFSGYNG